MAFNTEQRQSDGGFKIGSRLLTMTGGGALGGLVGFILSELYQDDGRSFYSEGEMRTSSGIWFMLIVVGIGSGLVAAQSYLSRSRPDAESLVITAPALIVGGFLSGYIAQSLYSSMVDGNPWLARTLGWGLAGMLAGAAASAGFKSVKRLQNGVLGGLAGGLVGGALFNWIADASQSAVGSRFVGIMLIGTLMGLLIGLIESARVTMWLEVLTGEFRGRQFVVHDTRSRVGSARSLEVPLLGDRGIAEVHCVITGPPSASMTCIQGQQVLMNGSPSTASALSDGDVLRIGSTDVRVHLKASSNGVAQPGGHPTPGGQAPTQPGTPGVPPAGVPGPASRPSAPASAPRPRLPTKKP